MIQSVIDKMREEALGMSQSSRIRATLLRYVLELEQALQSDWLDAPAPSKPPTPSAPPPSIPDGTYDCGTTNARMTYKNGKLVKKVPKRIVERVSSRRWGKYPEMPGVG